jgi:hypothetical protein
MSRIRDDKFGHVGGHNGRGVRDGRPSGIIRNERYGG